MKCGGGGIGDVSDGCSVMTYMPFTTGCDVIGAVGSCLLWLE